jgi:Ca2+-transporting ATPase
MTGGEVAALDDEALAQAVADVGVFARVMPDQKLRIVTALKARGEIVAMTGDGVNDAPSLKAAHIGVAMGGRGTDVAREASSIVLLDDDFGSIVAAVRLGRRIYDNLRKAMGFIVAVHVPIAGLALLPLVLGYPVVFGPIHIAFIEMIVDPVCALVFENEEEEADVMTRPPRHPETPLFSYGLIGWSMLQGLVAFAVAGGVYLVSAQAGMEEAALRAVSFLTLVLAIVGLIYVNRSFSASPLAAFTGRNRALVVVPVLVGTALASALLVPWITELFGFGAISLEQVGISLGLVAVMFLTLEALKAGLGRTRRH